MITFLITWTLIGLLLAIIYIVLDKKLSDENSEGVPAVAILFVGIFLWPVLIDSVIILNKCYRNKIAFEKNLKPISKKIEKLNINSSREDFKEIERDIDRLQAEMH